MRVFFSAGKPSLRTLAQYDDLTMKKQAENYSYHLGNIHLTERVDALAFRKAKRGLRKDTIIAYDCTDISKEYATKMERLSDTFDGSRRQPSPGFLLHGVGMNNVLLKLHVHDAYQQTANQTRHHIVQKLSGKLHGKCIWVFDRGNDDKQFFRNCRQVHDIRFIARLREERHVIIAKTGENLCVKNLPGGVHVVWLPGENERGTDWGIGLMTVVVHNHLENQEPSRLITNLRWQDYGVQKIVNMYCDRWGIENIFRRAKTKVNIEAIRVLKYQKFVNLIALIQLAVLVSTITFLAIQESTQTLVIGVLSLYELFLNKRALRFNGDSFIAFMQSSLKPLSRRHERSPPKQMRLFSWRQEMKMA